MKNTQMDSENENATKTLKKTQICRSEKGKHADWSLGLGGFDLPTPQKAKHSGSTHHVAENRRNR